MTRQQAHLTRAMKHVTAVYDDQDKPVRDSYGNLCHAFPVMVRTNGLCQAVAFVAEKQRGWDDEKQKKPPKPRAKAYHCLIEHVADTLNVTASGSTTLDQELLNAVRTAPLLTYMRCTTLVLEAWVYYKRLAVSVLEVEAGATPPPTPEDT